MKRKQSNAHIMQKTFANTASNHHLKMPTFDYREHSDDGKLSTFATFKSTHQLLANKMRAGPMGMAPAGAAHDGLSGKLA